MARTRKAAGGLQKIDTAKGARSVRAVKGGIPDSSAFRGVMTAIMCDLVENKIHPVVSNAVCVAGRNVLKAVEMEHRFALKPGPAPKRFALTS